ncbi:MAG: hypothetical protein J7K09_07980 [Desulfuromusa sp.]|nr:hypothetical protein [Desulfuromusa sp.]
MQKILFLLMVVIFSGMTVQAMTYSCRDNQGQLHMTDNLQSLPPECLGRTNTIQGGGSDSLSIVPGPEKPQDSGADFQKAVNDAAQKQKLRREMLDNLLPRAERAVAQYQQAAKEIYNTTRSGRLNYQAIMTRAKEQQQQALAEKQNILAEIAGPGISRKDRGIIASKLDEIKN